jgi:TonB family protein
MRAPAVAVGAVCAILSSFAAGPVGASDKTLAENIPLDYCAITVYAYAIPGREDELAFGLWSDDVEGNATGSIVAYVSGKRYTIPFENALATDKRKQNSLPTPIVVRFETPVKFESAYVGSLAGGDCAIHAPYTGEPETAVSFKPQRNPIYPDWSAMWPVFIAQANAQTPLPAPLGEPEASLTCSTPYAPARTKSTEPAHTPHDGGPWFAGTIFVKVAITADGSTLALRVEKSSRVKAYDESAVIAAAQARYVAQIYRCAPVSGDYLFIVQFEPN